MSDRQQLLQHWLASELNAEQFQLAQLTGDASFRRYYRLQAAAESYIVMDAPPEHENCAAFAFIDRLLEQHEIVVPHIHAYHPKQGFMLLSDFGDILLLSELNASTVDSYYQQAMRIILNMQTKLVDTLEAATELPAFDAKKLQQELALFSDWFVVKLCNCQLTTSEQNIVADTFERLVNNSLDQPQVFVHRDFHSRNLMCLDDGGLGVLDFQDAVLGPITYDLVSLLKDCYITWPAAQVQAWIAGFYTQLKQANMLDATVSLNQFTTWFHMQGMQRHIKVLGIFSRLYLRDGKAEFLGDLPRVLQYVLDVCEVNSKFEKFGQLLSNRLRPCMQEFLANA